MMKTKKTDAPVAVKAQTPEVKKKRFSFPAIKIKKGMLIKTGIVLVIILVLIPVLDWVIQTSIVSKYAAFYKNADITRTTYVKEMERQYGESIVNELLAKAAIAQAAKEKNIVVTEEEITAAVDADKAKAGITTDEDFKTALAQSGITETDYRAYVKVTVTLDKLLGDTVAEPTEDEIATYYAENKTLYADSKLSDVKTQIAAEIKSNTLTTKRQEWISAALANYNASNTLVSSTSRKYKFMRSVDLVKRLFSTDPTK